MASTDRWIRRRARTPYSQPSTTVPLVRTLMAGMVDAARAAFVEPFMLKLEQHEIKLRRLPHELDGLRIVQLTDIHHSPLQAARRLSAPLN
ncbi:MAG: hypothetical protein WKF84_29030 [Pyrinomonadaceae bacterium]